MDRDTEQRKLLAIFHYGVAGLATLFSFFPMTYTAVGVIFIFAAPHATAKSGEELPPEFLGWGFRSARLAVIRIRSHGGDLYSHRRPIARTWQALLVRTRDCLHRMSLRSVRDDSRSLYERVALSRQSVKALFSPTETLAPV